MKLTIRDGMVWNEVGKVVAVLTEDTSERDARNIAISSEAMPIIEDFIKLVNSGKFKPRAVVKTLETIISNYKTTTYDNRTLG